MKGLAITGHRPNKLWGYDLNDTHYIKLKKIIQVILLQEKPEECITGMALGVDTIFAQAVLELKENGFNTKLICAIPCLNHSCKWNYNSRQEYNRILSLADEVVMVTEKEYSPELMQIRNEYMVDRADKVLAVWNGSHGGTGNCVAYASQVGKTIVQINSNIFI